MTINNENKITTAIILAGGKGTRLAEQTKVIPKPLVKVGPDPAIIHIIRHFVRFGVKNIYIAGGYKFELLASELEKRFNINKMNGHSDSFKVISNSDDLLHEAKITIVDSGYSTDTAHRIKRTALEIPQHLRDEGFFVTYGDSFSDVDLHKVTNQHLESDAIATLTAVNFQERFGILKMGENNKVAEFTEKSQSHDEFINGGYIACNNSLLDVILDTDGDFSKDTLPRLQSMNALGAYVHNGFWFAMDSQRDYEKINAIYNEDPENFLK